MAMLASSGPPVRLRRTFSHVTPLSAASLRHWVSPRLRALGIDPDTIGIVELAATELLANIVRHAQGGARVAVAVQTEAIRISCTDDHPETADKVRPADDMLANDEYESMRGLMMLKELSTSGVHVLTRDASKSVVVRLPIGGGQ